MILSFATRLGESLAYTADNFFPFFFFFLYFFISRVHARICTMSPYKSVKSKLVFFSRAILIKLLYYII